MNLKKLYLMLSVAAIGSFSACSPDEAGSGNGLTATDVDATFTVTPSDGTGNRYVTESSKDIVGHKWDFGDGNPGIIGGDSEPVFFPDADTYVITHTAIGRGGITSTATQTVTVATSDPTSGNLIKGGKFKTAADVAQWTVLNISASNASVTLEPGTGGAAGKATFVGTGYSQKGIYQKVTLQADKEYTVDMAVSSAVGIKETWFEIYLLTAAPVDGNDYGGDKILRLNSWDCGNNVPTPFSGLLSALNCENADGTATKKGIIKVTTAGDYYFLIKSGGNQNSSVSVTNISLRGKAS